MVCALSTGRAEQPALSLLQDRRRNDVSLETASKRAHDVLNAVHVEERDPIAERSQRKTDGALCFSDLFDEWYARHARPNLARHETDLTYYRCHIKGDFAKRSVAELKRVEIARYRDSVARKTSPLVSNEVLMLINRVLNWSLDEGLIDANPAARLRKVGKKRPRERVLSEDEIRTLWHALARMDDDDPRPHEARRTRPDALACDAIVVAPAAADRAAPRRGLGARKSELELSGPDPVWTIPGARTKNRILHRVPLAPMAAAEFARAVAASPKIEPVRVSVCRRSGRSVDFGECHHTRHGTAHGPDRDRGRGAA